MELKLSVTVKIWLFALLTKGEGIVLLKKEDYLKERHNFLLDNGTFEIFNKLKRLIEKGYKEGIIDKKEKIFLVPLAPRVPTIYYLPKVHKCLEKPPVRPIVSGNDSVTS